MEDGDYDSEWVEVGRRLENTTLLYELFAHILAFSL